MLYPSLLSTGSGLLVTLPTASRDTQRQRALHEHRHSLQRHVLQCQQARSRWNSLGCAAELIHSLLAPRFVTTVTVVAAALALSAYGM
ncbi:hypothetical protein [Aquabacterium sp.]|uniref:hypothetical protein n=1 Tax=Aquabacterium sp. TaxID=1872578 RepID=UPI002BF858F1|nr:hypothetical protein [Aquabacterium sp.]HSW04599.1 hypothetical protein [Aquabacterium sp.]